MRCDTICKYSALEYDELSAELIYNKLKILQSNKTKICIALSGGSTPIPILKKLKAYKLDWNKFHFFMVDERFVDINHKDNNYGNIKQAFYDFIPSKSYPMIINTDNIDVSVKSYDCLLRNEVISVNEKPKFDLIILGMGNDGHTASLFPDTEGLKEENESVIKNYVSKFESWRVTLTYPTILNANEIIVMLKGKEKKEIFKSFYLTESNEYPIAKVSKEHNHINWLIEH